MATIKNLYINKLTFEDIEWGLGTVQQMRAGKLVTLNQVNLGSLPIDATTTMGDISGLITIVADNIGDISIAASNVLDINTVAASITNVNTVAGSIDNVNGVAGSIANINTVAPHVGNIDNVATNITNVNNVGNNVAKVVDVANDLTNIDAVNANKTNIDIVANDKANIDITASSINDVNTYAKTYYGPLATNPTTRPDGTAIQTGDMYFGSTLSQMKVYDGTLWKAAGSTINGTSQRQSFTATAGQTTFTIVGGYDATFADVYLNGKKLLNGTDVDVSSGTDVVISVGVTAGDIIDVVAYGAFDVANTYTKAEIGNGYATKTLSTTADLDVLNKVKNVDGPGSGLDADTVDGVQGALLGIGGAGYSWVNETVNRAVGTTYTNTTGKPIMVCIVTGDIGTLSNTLFIVGGITMLESITVSGSRNWGTTIVPNNSTYSITADGGINSWIELK